jgi:aryl-alcohol dehydrogenase-like predicted oxidoreductase
MNRRILLGQLAAAGAISTSSALSKQSESDRLGSVLPKRTLGKSGDKVTCLGLGGYHIGWMDSETQAQAVIEKALEVGVRFFDTAESYGSGRSEERYGKYLIPRYRNDIYLMTKTQAKDADTAREHLHGSLKRMNTDHIDLWQIHALESPDDVDARLGQGVLEEVLKAQQAGKVRRIGFTGHASPYAHTRMLENKAVCDACTCCQLPINPVDAASPHSFVERVIPKLMEADMGILAMKTLADGHFFASKEMNGEVKWTSENPVIPNALSMEECIMFALSMPITVLITGAEKPEYVEEKAAMVRRFSALSAAHRLALVEKVAAFAEEGEVEYYKSKELGKL